MPHGKSCGVERVETEVEVMPITRRTVGVFDWNSAVYHDAANTNPQTDVSILDNRRRGTQTST